MKFESNDAWVLEVVLKVNMKSLVLVELVEGFGVLLFIVAWYFLTDQKVPKKSPKTVGPVFGLSGPNDRVVLKVSVCP